MKKHFTQILSIFLSGIMLTGAAAFSAGAAPKEQQRFTEITVKKSEILQKGAFKAIQSALNAARYSATRSRAAMTCARRCISTATPRSRSTTSFLSATKRRLPT